MNVCNKFMLGFFIILSFNPVQENTNASYILIHMNIVPAAGE